MKHVIFGDIHDTDLKPLEKTIEELSRDYKISLVCLGDFDDTESMLKTKALMEKYGGVAVPGNHDEMLARKFVNFISSVFNEGKSPFMYACRLHNDPIALDYIKNLLYGDKEPGKASSDMSLICQLEAQAKRMPIHSEIFSKADKNAVVVHGGLAGNMRGVTDLPEEIKRLWYRLYNSNKILSSEAAERNFKEMQNIGCNIMIRGHDHVQSYAYKRENGSIDTKADRKTGFNLFPKRMHIINPGAYYQGDYAIIDTDNRVPVLYFHEVKL